MLKKIFKFCCIIIILLLLACFSVFLALFFRISLFYSPAIFIGIILLYFITRWSIKKLRLYLRRRKVSGEETSESIDKHKFEESFNNAMLHTKKHNREYKGKMPWYIMFGTSDNGKSSLLSGSNFYTLSEGIEANNEVLPTKRAYCWALDNMVVAESSGDLFSDKPSTIAKIAWSSLKSKIKANFRYINFKGFIVTLSVDQLKEDKESLTKYALKLREKIAQCSRGYGYSYPIYLVITKADHIQGFESFALGLPEEIQRQGFGLLFPEMTFYGEHKAQINQWAEYINERIRGINTLQLQASGSLLARSLLLENQINQLKKPLKIFLAAFFKVKAQIREDNPVLRGLFLTSVYQDAMVDLMDQGTILEGLSLPRRNRTSSKNLFVEHLFTSTLPVDFNLYQRLSKKLLTRKRYYQRALTAWWILFIGGSIYLGTAYAHAMKAFMQIQQTSKIRHDQFGNNLNYNMLLLSEVNEDINNITSLKKRWFFSVWPYTSVFNKIITDYKQYYVSLFDQYIVGDLEHTLANSVKLVTTNAKYKDDFGYVVENLIQGINLIQAKLELMPYSEINALNMEGLILDSSFQPNNYGILFKNYVAWNTHLLILKRQRGLLLNLLDELDIFNKPFGWLYTWVNQARTVPPILASNYWPDNTFNTGDEPKISANYTQAGMQQIKALFHNMAHAYLQPTEVEQYSLKFFAQYDLKRYQAWENFTNSFRSDINTIPSQAAWYSLAQLNLINSPYALYAKDLAFNYTDSMLINQPEWLRLFLVLRDYFKKSAYSLLVAERQPSFWDKIVLFLDQYSNELDSRVEEITYDDNLLKAIVAYQKNLLKLQKYVLTLDQTTSFSAIKSLFSAGSGHNENTSSNTSSTSNKNQFYTTYNAFQQIKFFATTDLSLLNKNEATWNLYRGMFDLLLHGAMENAMCYTEQMWDNQVLGQYAASLSHSHLSLDDLFGQKSIISKFMYQYVYPFVSYDGQKGGYIAKSVFGHKVKFSPFVYDYIRNQYDYNQIEILENQIKMTINKTEALIPIQIKPTNVNKDAKLLPVSTSLEVLCDKKKQQFTNFSMVANFSLTNNIFSCSSAEVVIQFEGATNFKITKSYTGAGGLLELIKDFSQGSSKTFKAVDFPDNYSKLQDYDISELTVNINFQGLEPIQSLLTKFTQRKAQLEQNVYGKLADWQYLDVTDCWNDQSWVTKASKKGQASIQGSQGPVQKEQSSTTGQQGSVQKEQSSTKVPQGPVQKEQSSTTGQQGPAQKEQSSTTGQQGSAQEKQNSPQGKQDLKKGN
ncbi:hypothetical protein L3V82_08450 [Thiotrichales bacterium 19S3-7]|nr:hypothetical protein [Thiotrichales bacterium 19S3-7]MCF6802137.1 hypothetical protein [Thiotrichales bacterium 19S3-11]